MEKWKVKNILGLASNLMIFIVLGISVYVVNRPYVQTNKIETNVLGISTTPSPKPTP